MLTLIALSALLQEPPAPPAPPPPPEVHARFAFVGHDGPGGLDKDGDGQITREEFAAPMTDAFARMDKDGDGRLSSEEVAESHSPGGAHDVLIRRGDGGPGPHRFEIRGPGGPGHGEVLVEPDGDRVMVFTGRGGPGERIMIAPHGEGSRERRVEVHRLGGEDREFVVHADGEGPRRIRLPHGGMGGDRVVVHHFGDHGDMDKDGDGRVSEAEFTGPLREAFGRMDADRSGFLEEGERGGDGEVRVVAREIETREGE